MKGDIIPNGEYLYKYLKPESLPEDQSEIPYGIFEDKELSCDWEQYQKHPEKSFHIKEGKNLILRITVCEEIKTPCNPKQPRQKQPAWQQEIIHDPIAIGEDKSHPDISNESHSLIRGPKKIHITKAIADNSVIYKLVNLIDTENSDEIISSKKAFENDRFSWNFTISVSIAIIFFIILIIFFFMT